MAARLGLVACAALWASAAAMKVRRGAMLGGRYHLPAALRTGIAARPNECRHALRHLPAHAAPPTRPRLQGSDSIFFDAGVLERWYTFGFDAGGSVDLTVTLPDASQLPGPDVGSSAYAWVAICDSGQLDTVLSLEGQYGTGGLCWPGRSTARTNASVLASCFASAQLSNTTGTSWQLSGLPVPYSEFFSFLVMVCTDPPHGHNDDEPPALADDAAAALASSGGSVPPPLPSTPPSQLLYTLTHAQPGPWRSRVRSNDLLAALEAAVAVIAAPVPPPPVGQWSMAGVTLGVDFNFMNPGGEALSTADIPLKGLTLAALVVWLAGTGLLGLAAFAAKLAAPPPSAAAASFPSPEAYAGFLRQYGGWALSPVRPLHLALGAVGVVWAATAACSWRYWTLLSASGVANGPLALMLVFLDDAASLVLLALLLLVALGWQVTRLAVTPSETRQTAFLLLIYGCSWLVYELLGGVVSLALLLLVYVICLRYVLAASTGTLVLLRMLAAYTAALVRSGAGVVAAGGAPQQVQTANAQHQQAQEQDSDQQQPLQPGGGAAAADAFAPAGLAHGPAGGGGSALQLTSGYGSLHDGGDASPGGSNAMGAGGSASPHGSRRWRWTLRSFRQQRRSLTPSGSAVASGSGGRRSRRGRSLTERQISTLQRFRFVVGGYLLLHVGASLWGDLALVGSRYEYMAYASAQALSLGLFLYLLLLFRPRRAVGKGPLFDPRGYAVMTGGGAGDAAGGAPGGGSAAGGTGINALGVPLLGSLFDYGGGADSDDDSDGVAGVGGGGDDVYDPETGVFTRGGGASGRAAACEPGASAGGADGSGGPTNVIILHPDSLDADGKVVGSVAMAVAVPVAPAPPPPLEVLPLRRPADGDGGAPS